MTEMIEGLGGMVRIPQNEAALLMEAGYLLMELNKHKEAEEVFAGVAAMLPNSDIPRVALGNLFFSAGRWSQALKAHKDALKARPESALAYAHLGEVLLFMKKFGEAETALRKAMDLESEDGTAAEFAKTLLDAHEMGVFDSVE